MTLKFFFNNIKIFTKFQFFAKNTITTHEVLVIFQYTRIHNTYFTFSTWFIRGDIEISKMLFVFDDRRQNQTSLESQHICSSSAETIFNDWQSHSEWFITEVVSLFFSFRIDHSVLPMVKYSSEFSFDVHLSVLNSRFAFW